MAEYYAYQGLCLCPRGGRLPQGATPVAAPFHPLLYLVERDPLTHGALRPLPGPDALDAPEDVISALSGQIGNLNGVSVKTACSGVI